MTRRIGNWFAAAIGTMWLLGLGTAVHAQGAFTWDGVYSVEGTNPDGSTYTGMLQIARVEGLALYQLTWALADGTTMTAFALEHNGQLSAGGLDQPLAFAVGRDLDARWAIPRSTFTTLGREKLTRTAFKTLEEATGAPRRAHRPRRPDPRVREATAGRTGGTQG